MGLQRELTERLNPGAALRWRVVRNLPVQPSDEHLHPHFEILDGAALDEGPEAPAASRRGSYHHALGLNVACRDLRTRFVMLLDPDCFVVRPGWIADVLTHMRDRGLAAFGTPYHPRSPAKVRYVPNAVCMVVDTELLALEGLDWTPGTGMEPAPPRVSPTDRLILAALKRLSSGAQRLRVESSVDTGIEVYRHAVAQGVEVECTQPVVLPAHMRSEIKHPKQRVLEAVLPDRYCLLPRHKGYITDRAFATFGHPDTAVMGCEEFCWRDVPFALHLRGGPRELRDDPRRLRDLLASFSVAEQAERDRALDVRQ